MTKPPSFRWPLAVNTFDLADKRAIADWLMGTDQFTMGAKVAEFEAAFSEFSGMHALGVSSGSTANQLVFEIWKTKNPGVKPVVIVPACTWISSVSPALMAGCDIAFCDVNLTDFAFDYGELERMLAHYTGHGRRVILFPTALIGFSPNMALLARMARHHGADLFLDSCENTFSQVPEVAADGYVTARTSRSILASAEMTTTSCYFSHQVVGVEFGFTFFRDRADFDLGRMFRNHGLSRSLPVGHPVRAATEAANPTVDPEFLFALGGTNLRPTDVHAVFGLRDFQRIPQARAHRNAIYWAFYEQLDQSHYYLPPLCETHVGFCLPIFTRRDNLREINAALVTAGIQRRPIIGGNLLAQPPFQTYGRPQDFPNAQWIHERGAYVGLHAQVTLEMVGELTTLLNGLAARVAA